MRRRGQEARGDGERTREVRISPKTRLASRIQERTREYNCCVPVQGEGECLHIYRPARCYLNYASPSFFASSFHRPYLLLSSSFSLALAFWAAGVAGAATGSGPCGAWPGLHPGGSFSGAAKAIGSTGLVLRMVVVLGVS